ncbi:hypothetical protein P7C70_g663, partial [Phenoliferia sp. Uapishka_3]
MVAPQAPLLISSTPAYLESLHLELPYLLVEAMASLTTSTFLRYSIDDPPSSRRLSSMNREAMLSQRLIPLSLNFFFDPRKPTPRTQFTLASAELLTRKAVEARIRELENGAEDEGGTRSFAQSEAREASFQRGNKVTSFYTICSVYMGFDVPGRNERGSIQNMIYRATIRPDAFEKPAKSSGDWFKFLRTNLLAPQKNYDRMGRAAIYELTADEVMIAFTEVVRKIAVDKLDYPPKKEVDLEDDRIRPILTIFSAGLYKSPKGGRDVDMPKAARDFGLEIMGLKTLYHDDGVRKVLSLRLLKELGRSMSGLVSSIESM